MAPTLPQQRPGGHCSTPVAPPFCGTNTRRWGCGSWRRCFTCAAITCGWDLLPAPSSYWPYAPAGGPCGFGVLAPWALGSHQAPGRRLLVAASLGLGLVASCGLVLCDPDARAYLSAYAAQQLGPSLLGQRETTRSHGLVLYRLLEEQAVGLAVVVLLRAVQLGFRPRWHRRSWPAWCAAFVWPSPDGTTYGLLGLGLSGILPWLCSPKQSGWYIYPGLPFIAMSLARWTAPTAAWLQSGSQRPSGRRLLATLALIPVLGSLIAARLQAHRPGRYTQVLQQIPAWQTVLPSTPVIVSVCPAALAHDWGLAAHLQRRLHISLTATPAAGTPWWLVDLDGGTHCPVPAACVPVLNSATALYFICLPRLPASALLSCLQNTCSPHALSRGLRPLRTPRCARRCWLWSGVAAQPARAAPRRSLQRQRSSPKKPRALVSLVLNEEGGGLLWLPTGSAAVAGPVPAASAVQQCRGCPDRRQSPCL